MKKALCFLLVLLCLLPSFAVFSDDAESEYDALLSDILQYEIQKAGVKSVQEFVNTAMSENPADGAEWYLLSLKSLNPQLDFSRYGEALSEYLETNKVTSDATRKKIALVLLASGQEDHPFVSEVQNEDLTAQGIMGYVFALHLLNNRVTLRGHTVDTVVEKLLSLVLEDGGWALQGKFSDADVTAMVLQALAPHREKEAVRMASDKAFDRLASLQKPDGDFSSYGVTNPESGAQVIMALTSFGIDPWQDARFVQGEKTLLDGMLKYRLADGSFCHTEQGDSNLNATVQVFCALTSLSLFEKGKGSIYEIGDYSHLPLPSDSPSNLQTAPTEKHEEGIPTWKWYAVGGIFLIAALLLILLLKMGKKATAFLVLVSAILLSGLLLMIRIQTPDEYYRYEEPENPIGQVTFSIRCDAVAGQDNLPKDGVILAENTYSIGEGDSVYDLLLRVTKAHKIPLATSGTYSRYVAGIDNLFETDHGDTSGWVYTVNGKSPSVACDGYLLQNGDTVVFSYTLTLGMVEES